MMDIGRPHPGRVAQTCRHSRDHRNRFAQRPKGLNSRRSAEPWNWCANARLRNRSHVAPDRVRHAARSRKWWRSTNASVIKWQHIRTRAEDIDEMHSSIMSNPPTLQNGTSGTGWISELNALQQFVIPVRLRPGDEIPNGVGETRRRRSGSALKFCQECHAKHTPPILQE